MRRLVIFWVALALVSGLGAAVAATEAPTRWRTDPAALGAPFDAWDVTVTPSDEEPNLITVEFDSEAVGQRATSLVWLPDAYFHDPGDFPVAYFLHGQGDAYSFGAGQALGAAGAPVPYPFGPPGSSTSFGGIDPKGTAAERSFLLVGIDNGPRQWCGHCWYTDGVGDAGVDAERHILDEVAPLIETLFRARTDRGGRGILGNSMGANGSLLVGFRHPDRFAFVGALSPTYPSFENPALRVAWTNFVWQQYLADQGYAPPAAEPARWDAVDPLFYSAAVNAAGTEVMTAIGDGCLPNDGRGVCSSEPATGDPDQELGFRVSFDSWAQTATQRGVRFTNIQREGAHNGTLNHDNFLRYFLPRMNEVFAGPVNEPERFSYRSVDDKFEIFGWNLAVSRPNVETLHVLGARTDGTEITLAGTGAVQVTTPPLRARRPYQVVATPDGGTPIELAATVDDAGRLSFEVALAETRSFNETRELVDSGRMQFPHTTIRIVAAP